MSVDVETGFAPLEFFFRQEHPCFFCDDAHAKKQRLASTEQLFGVVPFAEVFIGYNETALVFDIEVQTSKISVSYPDIEKADSIELFIDTRDNKLTKTTHRFCHHFFFLPESFEGHTHGEITRFRTDDTHPLCVASDIEYSVTKKKNGYTAHIVLPAHVLVGYQPNEHKKIGFCYRINTALHEKQTFGLPLSISSIIGVSYLWPTLCLESRV